MTLRVSIQEAVERGWIKGPVAASVVTHEKKRSGAKRGESIRDQRIPQNLLFAAVQRRIDEVVAEYRHAVPGRRFRLDCAIPSTRIAIELDGWQWHGKHLDDFKRDRERDRLLVMNGWKVMRYTAKEVMDDADACATQVLQLHLDCTSRRA